MDSGLHTYGTFWLFAGFTLIGTVVTFIFMKETKGLTDKEKKTLYSVRKHHITS
jgi:hypothetical protein